LLPIPRVSSCILALHGTAMAFHYDENFMTPPHTPRHQPISTPTVDRVSPMNSPPQLGWQLGTSLPVNGSLDSSEQLSRALDRGNVEEIRRVLDADPDAAWMPVFMDGMQPPLCAAIWLHCDLRVIELLIARGAKVGMLNSHGQGPLSVLASCRCALGPLGPDDLTKIPGVPDLDVWFSWHNKDFQGEQQYKKMEHWILTVAVQLLQADCSITDKDNSGRTPVQVALDNGWPYLASLIQGWQDFKTCVMLKRMVSRNKKEDSLDCFHTLPSTLVCHLLEFVTAGVPAHILASAMLSLSCQEAKLDM